MINGQEFFYGVKAVLDAHAKSVKSVTKAYISYVLFGIMASYATNAIPTLPVLQCRSYDSNIQH